MRLLTLLISLISVQSAVAETTVQSYEKLGAELQRFNPLKQSKVDQAVKLVEKADQEVLKFSELKYKRSEEFAALVTLVGYALPLSSFPESVEIIKGISEGSPDLDSALKEGLRRLDPCRHLNLKSRLGVVGGPQDGKNAELLALAQPGEFKYEVCVKKRQAKPKTP